jgi:hypothetical protein
VPRETLETKLKTADAARIKEVRNCDSSADCLKAIYTMASPASVLDHVGVVTEGLYMEIISVNEKQPTCIS